ncbi:MAG: diguanylate cyclase [Actinomycetota bacterium]|nr:diguanylate cyclase [Actinomycetota bacterium]
MSLRRKLTLFFVLIVMLPLIAAAVVVHQVVVGEVKDRANIALQPALNTVLASYNGRAPYVDGLVERALVPEDDLGEALAGEDNLRDFLRARVGRSSGVDFLLVLNDRGIVEFASTQPRFVKTFEPPGARDIADSVRSPDAPSTGFVASRPVDVRVNKSKKSFQIIGGFWVDGRLLAAAGQEDVEVSLVAGQEVLASTERQAPPPPSGLGASIGKSFDVQVLGAEAARAQRLPVGDMAVVALTPRDPITDLSRQVLISELLLLALALLLTGGLAYSLARLITRPLDELTEGATAIAQGRFDHQIPVRSRDEVGALALAFNNMTARLKDTITELSSSRDQLQRAVRRVGETLRSTHDMRQILDSVINTATDAVEADAGVLWTFTSTRDELYPVIGTRLETKELGRIPVGRGIVGLVAERGTPIVVTPDGSSPRPSSSEPRYPVGLAIPLYSEDRITGVISLYRDAPVPFSREDFDTVLFLAEQGGVAIENVLLHDEARRLSITDGLTGVWNRRYLQMQFRQVLATATRFHRSFSVLMLDLDNFKVVNDTYGHQRGDAVLIEFAQRVNAILREVDTFARYGGEEFICLLSETDVAGALTTAEKIHEVIRSEPFAGVGEKPVHITTSIGLASFPDHADTYQGLVEAADRALYQAKQEGRDRVRIAGSKPPPNLKLA